MQKVYRGKRRRRLDQPHRHGPFVFERYLPNDRIVLAANKDYWKGAPALERFEMIFMPSLASRETALRRGEVDVIKGSYDSIWLKKMEQMGYTLDILGPGISGLFEFNMSIKPLDDWLVRAAIAYAIDREELVLAFGETLASAQLSPVPENFVYGIKGYKGVARMNAIRKNPRPCWPPPGIRTVFH